MADIQRYLDAIMAAVFGKDVRGSIHDAIDIINKVSEKQIDCGTAISAGDPAGSYYENSLYINTQTDELLRCNGATWVSAGGIRGNGIDHIDGPVTSGLDDEYTIHYTDGASTSFIVHNGKGMVSVTLYSTAGLVDTYRILYNDGTHNDFSVKNGNQWYYGTAVYNKAASPGASFILPYACKEGDSYLNISEDAIYHCTSGADAGSSSIWVYDFTITSSSTGTNDYGMLINTPKINNHALTAGNQTAASLGLQNELVEGVGIHINSLTNEISADVDAWLMDLSQTPPVPIERTMAEGSTKITFSQSEMAQASGYSAVEAFFQAPDGQAPPTLKKIIPLSTGALEVYYSKIKAAQVPCTCMLRLVK